MQNNVEIIQINISGEDKPGMTSSLTEIRARYDAFILDIGQANIHQLSLIHIFRTPPCARSEPSATRAASAA